MNENERIEAALRRRPSDEPDYNEPLAALAQSGPTRGVVMTRVRTGGARRGAVPALASLLMLVVLAAGVVFVAWPRGNAGPVGPAGPSGSLSASVTTLPVAVQTTEPGTPDVAIDTIVDTCKSTSCDWGVGFQMPVVSGIPAAAADRINATIEAKITEYIAEFKADTGTGDGGHDSLLGLCRVEYATPRLLSISFAMTIDVGNGYDEHRSLNFRVTDGSLINLADLFTDQSAALSSISTQARKQLRELSTSRGTDWSDPANDSNAKWIDDGTKPVLSNFDKAWVLRPWELSFTFDTAQVGPQSFGTPSVGIPLETLRPVLDPKGPAADMPAAEQPTASGTFQPQGGFLFTYQVVAGDTAASIAAKFGLQLGNLKAANPMVTDWDSLTTGQLLIVPSSNGPRVSPSPRPTFMTYYVKSGDYLSKIASTFNVPLCEIVAANPGLKPDHIEVGQPILIPVSGTVSCAAG